MARADNLNIPALVVTGVVSVLIVVAVVVLISAWFHRAYQAEVDVKQILPPSQDLRKVTLDQQSELNRYGWIDEEQGVVAIPIERAMELVVRESAARSIHSGSEESP
jgi:hypothetical protein